MTHSLTHVLPSQRLALGGAWRLVGLTLPPDSLFTVEEFPSPLPLFPLFMTIPLSVKTNQMTTGIETTRSMTNQNRVGDRFVDTAVKADKKCHHLGA